MDPCTTTLASAHGQPTGRLPGHGALLAEENSQLKCENLLLRQRIQALEQVLLSTPRHHWGDYLDDQRLALLLQTGGGWDDDVFPVDYEEEGDWNSFSSRLGPRPHLPTRPGHSFCDPARNMTTATTRHARVVEWQQQYRHFTDYALKAPPHLPFPPTRVANGGSERSDDSGVQQGMLCS